LPAAVAAGRGGFEHGRPGGAEPQQRPGGVVRHEVLLIGDQGGEVPGRPGGAELTQRLRGLGPQRRRVATRRDLQQRRERRARAEPPEGTGRAQPHLRRRVAAQGDLDGGRRADGPDQPERLDGRRAIAATRASVTP
jgi:hypothetical protein